MIDKPMGHPPRVLSGQAGSALIIALILLLVITVLAVAGMQNTILQERMAGNMHDRNIAFQNAESGLRTAQRGLPGNVDEPIGFASSNAAEWDDKLTVSPSSHDHYVELLEVEEPCDPADVVCDEGFPPTFVDVHRLTSKGVGGTEHAVVILQAIVW